MDVAVLEEGAARLARATTGLREAADGLERLPVAAVATGSDAVLDALADLGRRWSASLAAAADEAGRAAAALGASATAYAQAERAAERAAEDPLGGLLDAFDRTVGGVPGHDGRDGGPL